MNTFETKAYPSASVKVRLLQDALYSEDGELWDTLLRYQTHIERYFAEIGLELVIHEPDGFAYLKQGEQDEGATIPRLLRRDKLSRGPAIIGLLLREQLLRFEETVHDESMLTVGKNELLELAAPFFPETNDDLRGDKRIEAALSKAEDLGLIRKIPGDDSAQRYEVRRIVKARFPVETLKTLREELQKSVPNDDAER